VRNTRLMLPRYRPMTRAAALHDISRAELTNVVSLALALQSTTLALPAVGEVDAAAEADRPMSKRRAAVQNWRHMRFLMAVWDSVLMVWRATARTAPRCEEIDG